MGLTHGQLLRGIPQPPPGVSGYLLPDAVQEFQRRYPPLIVTARTGVTAAVTAGVRSGSLEIGLIEGELGPIDGQGLQVQALHEVDQLAVVGPRHPWWNRDRISLAELGSQTLIVPQRNSQSRVWLDALLHQHGLQPRIGGEFDNVESIKRAVMNSGSVALLPDYVVRSELEAGRLRALPIEDHPLQCTLRLVTQAGGILSPVARSFLRCIGACLPIEPASAP